MRYLLGTWTGTSRFTPAFQTARFSDETSTIDCQPAFKATYIRCSVRFYRTRDGRLRINERDVNKVPDKPGFSVVHFDSNWHGRAEYRVEWNEAEQAWIGLLPTDHEGQPATERIFEQFSADGKTVLHTESLRLNSTPNAPWTETFRWTWTKRQ